MLESPTSRRAGAPRTFAEGNVMLQLALRRLPALTVACAIVVAIGACSDDENNATNTTPDGGPDTDSGTDSGSDAGQPDADAAPPPCTNNLNFAPGQEQQLQDAVNSLTGCANITLAAGTYNFNNALTIRQAGVTLSGAGKGAQGEGTGGTASTVLVFTDSAANTNGVDVVGDRFVIRDLAIWNAKKDGLRVESSKNVKIQSIRTEWANENDVTNGAYGIYPVKSEDVLIEESEAYNAADAGIYVGQTQRAIVRKNIAKQNVAGIEIENTKFADVYENLAEDNTCGLVVFDLPGNPIAGTDIRMHANTVQKNNRPNFASNSGSSSTVSQVPAGTGTFILASRRVELFGNTWAENNTGDVAVLSGLVIEPDPAKWAAGGLNFGSKDIYIHDNTFSAGSGTNIDNGDVDPNARPLGVLLSILYGAGVGAGEVTRVEPVIWDGMDPDPTNKVPANDINLCVKTNTFPAGTSYAVADLNFPASRDLALGGDDDGAWSATTRDDPDAPIYACNGFTPALTPVVLP
jgi:parallel beta-helix repeat protein